MCSAAFSMKQTDQCSCLLLDILAFQPGGDTHILFGSSTAREFRKGFLQHGRKRALKEVVRPLVNLRGCENLASSQWKHYSVTIRGDYTGNPGCSQMVAFNSPIAEMRAGDVPSML